MSTTTLVAEAPGFLQVYSDGTVKRFAPDIVLATPIPSENYAYKDVVIDSSKPITGRIFLPTKTSAGKLPVLVYFHGGGFCIGSTTWLNYHVFLGDLASQANIIVLSVNYRLAPENRLPVAYLDALTSLEWLVQKSQGSGSGSGSGGSEPEPFSQADPSRVFFSGDSQGLGWGTEPEPWLNQADLSRVFFSGDSAGGNIAHNLAIKTTKNGFVGVGIKGLLLIHPFFGSESRTGKEMEKENGNEVKMNDMFWGLSIPKGLTRDYSGCNFESMNEVEDGEWSRFPSVVVFVAGLDFLMERGVMYGEYLKKKGLKNVKIVEAKDEGHVYHVYHLESEATSLLRRQMSDFINSF